MKYVSIDLETTGVDWEYCQVIEFGAVIEDTNNPKPVEELPQYHAYVYHPKDMLTGEVYALDMNKDIIAKLKNRRKLVDRYNFVKPEDIADDFLFWLHQNGIELKKKYDEIYKEEYKCVTLNVAGKNFNGFDRHFLDRIPGFSKKIRMRTRTLDPSILFVNWKEDATIPSLDVAKEKAGLSEPVAHTAVEDAIDVIKLLRKDYVR